MLTTVQPEMEVAFLDQPLGTYLVHPDGVYVQQIALTVPAEALWIPHRNKNLPSLDMTKEELKRESSDFEWFCVKVKQVEGKVVAGGKIVDRQVTIEPGYKIGRGQ